MHKQPSTASNRFLQHQETEDSRDRTTTTTPAMNPIGKLLPGGLAGIGVLFLCGKIYAMHTRHCELEEELRDMRARHCELEEELRKKQESRDFWFDAYHTELNHVAMQSMYLSDEQERRKQLAMQLGEEQKRRKQLEDENSENLDLIRKMVISA